MHSIISEVEKQLQELEKLHEILKSLKENPSSIVKEENIAKAIHEREATKEYEPFPHKQEQKKQEKKKETPLRHKNLPYVITPPPLPKPSVREHETVKPRHYIQFCTPSCEARRYNKKPSTQLMKLVREIEEELWGKAYA